VIPAWTLLTPESLRALVGAAGRVPDAIHLAATVSPSELSGVPMVAAARLVIERALAQDGLTLTARGFVSRADTSALFEALDWPDYPKGSVRAVNKVLNETDVLPVHLTRVLTQGAGLLRRHKGRLIATKRAAELLHPDHATALFRALFEAAFWRVNLSYFDAVPLPYWPQTQVGVVLWCLSVSAHQWMRPEALVASCTIPDDSRHNDPNVPTFALVARVLRPLTWFGLLETRTEAEPQGAGLGWSRCCRKLPLFDRVLSFRVALDTTAGVSH
jgi:hypothetical protein